MNKQEMLTELQSIRMKLDTILFHLEESEKYSAETIAALDTAYDKILTAKTKIRNDETIK